MIATLHCRLAPTGWLRKKSELVFIASVQRFRVAPVATRASLLSVCGRMPAEESSQRKKVGAAYFKTESIHEQLFWSSSVRAFCGSNGSPPCMWSRTAFDESMATCPFTCTCLTRKRGFYIISKLSTSTWHIKFDWVAAHKKITELNSFTPWHDHIESELFAFCFVKDMMVTLLWMSNLAFYSTHDIYDGKVDFQLRVRALVLLDICSAVHRCIFMLLHQAGCD